MKHWVGPALFAAPALVPVLIWFSANSTAFSGFPAAMASLGKIAGLAGISMFAMTLLMNTRLKVFDGIFGGVDRAYRWHHMFGSASFILILFHPVFLASQYLVSSVLATAMFFLSIPELPVGAGKLALGTMVVLLAMTFYGSMKYQRWRLSHQFIGLAFFLAGLHVLLIPSDVSMNAWLRADMVVMLGIGFTAYGYRMLLSRYAVRKHDYTVKDVKDLGSGITQLTLSPVNRAITHAAPGQFIFISLKDHIPDEVHPFTVSSAPDERDLRLSIKSLGDWTSEVKKVAKGTKARIEGPFGRFSYIFRPGKQLWIAGGIGITPFLSMARSLKSHGDIDLYYSTKTPEEAVFLKELVGISRLRIHPHFSEKHGHLTADAIIKDVPDALERNIFICGPPGMMSALKDQFIAKGADRQSIYMEEFSLL